LHFPHLTSIQAAIVALARLELRQQLFAQANNRKQFQYEKAAAAIRAHRGGITKPAQLAK
jgi:hypothetical protein